MPDGSFVCASDRTDHLPNNGYNCIAYAAGKTDKWWWPTDDPAAYWPPSLPFEAPGYETLGNFIKAFELEGYKLCKTDRRENGYEKVALYVDGTGTPTHAARSLPDGKWVSKLGKYEDIIHEKPSSVGGNGPYDYGTATTFLRRRNKDFKWQTKNPLKKLLWFILEILRKLFGWS